MTDELISDPYDRIVANQAGGPQDDEAYDRWREEAEAEYERLSKIPKVKGCSAVRESGTCEVCDKVAVLYSHTACTLGYPGHPGAEFTDFHICEECLTR